MQGQGQGNSGFTPNSQSMSSQIRAQGQGQGILDVNNSYESASNNLINMTAGPGEHGSLQ
jgi:hypothetical protein